MDRPVQFVEYLESLPASVAKGDILAILAVLTTAKRSLICIRNATTDPIGPE